MPVKRIVSVSIEFLFSGVSSLLEIGRKPDISVVLQMNSNKARKVISGSSTWSQLISFDAMGRNNAFAVGSHFEIPYTQSAFFHRYPDVEATQSYPSSYGLIGKVITLSENESQLIGRFRITNIRALFYAVLFHLLIYLMTYFMIHLYSGSAPRFIELLPLFIVTLPISFSIALIFIGFIARIFEPRQRRDELIRYLNHLFEVKIISVA